MDEIKDQTDRIPLESEKGADLSDTAPGAPVVVQLPLILDSASSELDEQPAPDPGSRVITPSEVAIAFASGAALPILEVATPGEPVVETPVAETAEVEEPMPEIPMPTEPAPAVMAPAVTAPVVPTPAAPLVDPGITGEFPVIAEEVTQMPELFEDEEPSGPWEAVSETLTQEQDVASLYENAATFVEPASGTSSFFAAEDESPVPMLIDEVAEAAVLEIAEKNMALADSEMITAEQAFRATATERPLEVDEEPLERGITVITKEATVLGDILTDGHIDVVGRVKGNIDAKGDVAIHGVVRGDVGGAKIGLYNCRVKGNLDAGLGVIVDDNSIIGGDVKTKNIIFDGKVKGNIDAENVVVLRSHSYCLGDVSAASLAIEPGAVLNGKVRTFVDGDLEAPFDEVI